MVLRGICLARKILEEQFSTKEISSAKSWLQIFKVSRSLQEGSQKRKTSANTFIVKHKELFSYSNSGCTPLQNALRPFPSMTVVLITLKFTAGVSDPEKYVFHCLSNESPL